MISWKYFNVQYQRKWLKIPYFLLYNFYNQTNLGENLFIWVREKALGQANGN